MATDLPVFVWHEGFDFPFAFDDQSRRHRLHSSGTQPGRDFAPQQWGDLIANDAIDDAAGLLSIDDVLFDATRAESNARAMSDLVMALKTTRFASPVGTPRASAKMPGDGLSFTVKVGREPDIDGLLRSLLKVRNG